MPSSDSHSGAVLELAEEFLDRYRRGERPGLREYIEQHPALADEIREVFPAMAMMENIAIDEEELGADPTAVDTTPAAPVLGQLGDYRIVREVGRGGMGIVYEAEQLSLGRHVALKVLPQTTLLDAKQRRRFDREARAAARLHHTNIVPVFGVGEADGVHYYVMQFIQGLGLDEVIAEVKRMQDAHPSGSITPPTGELKVSRRHDVPAEDVARSLMTGEFDRSGLDAGDLADSPGDSPREISETVDFPYSRTWNGPPSESGSGRLSDVFAVSPAAVSMPGSTSASESSRARTRTYWHSVARIGAQVSDALQHAHDQGILHRDIKPSNLLLDLRGTVWVTDFGLAKASDQQDITHTGDILGTLRYMPPEAFDGRSDARSDVYSLGLTLYELLAFRPAFREKDRHGLIRKVTTESAPRLKKLNPAIPRDLVTIVHKAIDRDPDHRYRTAGHLTADLQRFLDDEPIKARRIAPVERFLRWSRRNKLVASLGAALTAVLVIAAVASSVAAVRFRSLAGERERARAHAVEARDVAQRNAYVAQINLAQAAENRAEGGRVDELLDRWTYRRGQEDLRAWEWFYLRSGQSESRLRVPLPDPDFGVAWNPVRSLIAAAVGGGVRLIDAVTGAEVRELTGRRIRNPSGWVNCVAWSPDGTYVGAGWHDGTVRIWDADTSLELAVLDASEDSVMEVLWSPEGRWLAVRKWSGVHVWDWRREQVQLKLPPGTYRRAISWRDGNRLTALSERDRIETWDVETRKKFDAALPDDLRRGAVSDIAWSPDGSRLAAGYEDGAMGLWETERPDASGYLLPPRVTQGLRGLAWSPDGARVAGIRDGAVQVYDVATAAGPALARTFRPRRAVELISWSPDGRQLATWSGVDRNLEIFDLTGESSPNVVFRARPSTVGRVAWSPDGELLAGRVLGAALETGAPEAVVRIWDARTREHLRDLPALARRDVVAWNPDGRRLAVPEEGGIALWDARTGEKVSDVKSARHLPYCLAWSPDGRRIAAGHREGTISISDVASAVELQALVGHERRWGENYVRSVAWSPDERWLASVAQNGTVNIWDVSASRRTTVMQMGTQYEANSLLSAAQWSPDGARLAATSFSSSAQGTIWVWDVVDGEAGPPLRLRGQGGVRDLAWHPDGRRLASAGSDRTIRIWDVEVVPGASGEDSRHRSHELLTLRGHTDEVRSLSWNPLRPALVSSSEDGTIRLWDASRGYTLDRSRLSLAQMERGPAFEAPTAADLRSRGEIHAFLGEWDEAARDFDEAARLTSDDSDAPGVFLTPWWVAGFYGLDLSVPAPPEGQTDPWSPVPGDDGTEESWRPVFGRVGDVVNFPDLLGPGERISAYALTRIYSTRKREIPFLVGSDESIRLWVNGSIYEDLRSVRGRITDEDVFFVPLRKGWNIVLARVANELGGHSLGLRVSTRPVALARACEHAGRWKEAFGHWTEAIEADPENMESRVRRGRAALSLGRLEEARLDFAAAMSRHPDNPSLRIRLASLYGGHGDVEEARAVLDGLELDPSFLSGEAGRLMGSGEWRAAAGFLRIAVQTEPQLTLEWHQNSYYLAIILVHLGEDEEFRTLCRRMLEVFRDSASIQIGERMSKMCLFSSTLRDPELVEKAARFADFAIENVAEAISKNEAPSWLTPYVQHAKGVADYRRGRYDASIDWMRKSLEGIGSSRDPWIVAVRATSLFFSAMAHHHLGRIEESRERLAEAERERDALSPWWHSNDELILDSVRREARALVLGEKTGGE